MTTPVQRFALQRVLNTPAPTARKPVSRSFAAFLAQAHSPVRPAPSGGSRGAQRPLAASGAQPPVTFAPAGAGQVPFQTEIEAAASRYGLDPALLAAVAKTESGFNPRAQSGVGAKGLMQLMDATARGLGVKDSFDPAQSLDGGARFLSGLLKQFKGDVRLALAAYNAGPGAVQKYGGIPPYQETQRYVPKVLAQLDAFRRIWADHSPATETS
jgi:soluble lytic murein transglycosylase-like protein